MENDKTKNDNLKTNESTKPEEKNQNIKTNKEEFKADQAIKKPDIAGVIGAIWGIIVAIIMIIFLFWTIIFLIIGITTLISNIHFLNGKDNRIFCGIWNLFFSGIISGILILVSKSK